MKFKSGVPDISLHRKHIRIPLIQFAHHFKTCQHQEGRVIVGTFGGGVRKNPLLFE